MNEEEKEDLKDIIDDINRDVEMPPYDNNSDSSGYSRKYQEYKEEEQRESKLNRYEKLCYKSSSILSLKADESVKEDLNPPIKLLGWDITPGMVLSASVMVGFGAFLGWGLLFALNMMIGLFPTSIMLLAVFFSFGAGAYTYYVPIFRAKNKVIRSSGEMILSILYMVIYMRSSPNLEGAIRFAALNLDGPISDDLKGVLWDLEVGKYNRIEDSLENYTQAWKDYNEDYLESLQLLKAAVNEPNPDRRDDLLQDSIDRILDGTKEKMKHYAQNLKTPVMILNAMGAMLPVLGMIMLPLISVFMGGSIKIIHLFLSFNIMLPVFLYWFMQKILSSRPPTVSSKPVSKNELPERGKYTINRLGLNMRVPTWPIGLLFFLVIGAYGMWGYFSFPHFYPLSEEVANQVSNAPAIFQAETGYAPIPMLMRSISLVVGAGMGIGVHRILGNKERKEAEEHLEKIESQFPTALFQLGNKISGGTPIELALDEAAESTSDLEISGLFRSASDNVRTMGMTFEDAIFDEQNGSLREYPSQMIRTVMKAILESSEKGTKMASMAMTTISRYLDNIHQTQEQLNDLLEETTTTIQMLAYLLAPVVSGVAVGMSQTIITAMFQLSSSFSNIQGNIQSPGAGTGVGSFSGILGNLDTAIPPEALQLVVGIYLIQLLHILGHFYMKIRHGENLTYRNMFVGKILISGLIIYSISLILISVMFGGIIGGITAG
ncbi:MAG: type II secretion system F family protein [Candidatus Nanohalobium sp.]